MQFNSITFLLFASLVIAIYHGALHRLATRKRFLLLASWAFYATWDPRFLFLLIGSTCFNFGVSHAIARTRRDGSWRARTLLVFAVTVNLCSLALFKYARFLHDALASFLPIHAAGDSTSPVVPLAISFYTLHAISYVVDVHRGTRPPSRNLTDFALYIAFFPQLIAGPITRWGFFAPQLERPSTVGRKQIEAALFLIAGGFAKKVICADPLGAYVDGIYDDVAAAGSAELLVAFYAYAFQIYFDFSGYTDIAIGIASLLGFRLPENFRHPYLAANPSEFWHRWHMSLSTWLRDYVYIPLGGNRRGSRRTYVNLLATMLIGGLWHGAAWTFVLWGAFHGAWLIVHRALAGRRHRLQKSTDLPLWLRRASTFHLVAAGWVLFRADSVGRVAEFFTGLIAWRQPVAPFPTGAVLLILLGAVTHGLSLRYEWQTIWRRVPTPIQGTVYGVVLVLLALFSTGTNQFVYFAF